MLTMNDIDDILRTLGMPTQPPSSPTITDSPAVSPSIDQATVSEATPSDNTFSDEDIASILADNGYYEPTPQPEENPDAYNGIQDDFDEDNNEEFTDFEMDSDHTYDDEEASERESAFNETADYNEEAENTHNESLPESTDEDTSEATAPSEVPHPSISEDTLLPLNSPTLLIDEATTRFSGTEWYNEIQKSRIIVAGIGGIGSNLSFQLARMIPASITLYDNDNVETVNMAGQLYRRDDVGKAKVYAIADMISAYTSMQQVFAINERFTELTEPGDIMMCGFDSMRARKTFFNSWLRHISHKTREERHKCLYLDGRLSIDTLQILCIQGDDDYNIQRYQKEFLFYDSQADATICSMKQTTYLACMIGSLMVNLFTNFIANQLDPIIPYDLPFFTQYEAQNMIFKTEN